jgi:ABC-2 type transport system ATP-binding protein
MKKMEEEAIISVDHLMKDYGHGRGVFDINIHVHKGECFGYLGPNGAGKSTTIRHIMGFSKPQKGSIKVFGLESFNHTEEILGKVGYLPGEVALPLGLTGWEFLRMMQTLRGPANEEILERLLNTFELDPSGPTKRMSLGVKRKLAVVAAFMNDPEVLVLDEPTSGLDPLMQRRFIEFVLGEKKRGKTILISSHIFAEVDAMCDTITIIKDGMHVSTIKASDFKNPNIKRFLVSFVSSKEKERYIKEVTKFKIVDKSLNDIEVDFPKDSTEEFISSLAPYSFVKLNEIQFSLESYFMAFYKENKAFGGLSGIKGDGSHE